MKKIMTLLGVTAFALGAFAYTANQVGFESEDYETGKGVTGVTESYDGAAKAHLWYAEDPDNASVVTNYASAAEKYTYSQASLIDYTGATSPGDNYLSVESGSKPLYRSLDNNYGEMPTFQSLDGDIVADTLVQFTPSDSFTQNLDDGAKFALWLYVSSDIDAKDYGTTNLCVAAGGSANGSVATLTLEVPGVEVNPNEWHRVTIRAYTDVVSGRLGFVVYVDGQMAACTDAEEYANALNIGKPLTTKGLALKAQKALFLGVYDGENLTQNTQLAAVGFKGTGKVDDVSIVDGQNAPGFASAPNGFVITWDEGVVSFELNGTTYNNLAELYPQGCAFVSANKVNISNVLYDGDNAYSAGTWTAEGVVEETVEEGVDITINTDLAKVSICSSQSNFAVDGTPYSSLSGAIGAAEDVMTQSGIPGLIALRKNYILSGDADSEGYVSPINVSTNIVLDLAGYTIINDAKNNKGWVLNVKKGGSLTIIDSEGSGKVSIVAAQEDPIEGFVRVVSGGRLIIGQADGDKGVTFDGAAVYQNKGTTSVLRGNFLTSANDTIEDYVDLATTVANPGAGVFDGYTIVTPAPFDFEVAFVDHASVSYTIGSVTTPTNATAVVAVPYDSTITVTYAAETGYTLTGNAVSNYANTASSSAGQVVVSPNVHYVTFFTNYVEEVDQDVYWTNWVEYATANYTYGDVELTLPEDPAPEGFHTEWYSDEALEIPFVFNGECDDDSQRAYAKFVEGDGPAPGSFAVRIVTSGNVTNDYATLEAAIADYANGDVIEFGSDFENLTENTVVFTKEGVFVFAFNADYMGTYGNMSAAPAFTVTPTYPTELNPYFTYTVTAKSGDVELYRSGSLVGIYSTVSAAYGDAASGDSLVIKLSDNFSVDTWATGEKVFDTITFQTETESALTVDTFTTPGSGVYYYMSAANWVAPANVTLKLYTQTVTSVAAGTLNVPAGVTLTLANGGSLDGIGAGYLAGDGVVSLPSATVPTGTLQLLLQKSAYWHGTFALNNTDVLGGQWNLTLFGNANSTVRFNNSGFAFKPNNVSAHAVKAIEVVGGGLFVSGNCDGGTITIPAKIIGSGKITVEATGSALYTVNFTGDFSEFAGDMEITSGSNGRVYIGANCTGGGKCISISNGATATVAAGKTWNSQNGFVVLGTLNVAGTLKHQGGSASSVIYGAANTGRIVFKNAAAITTFGGAYAGEIVIDSIAAGGTATEVPLNFGCTAAKLTLNGVSGNAWCAGSTYTNQTELTLAGNVNFQNGGSNTEVIFRKIADGNGNLSLKSWSNCKGVTYGFMTLDADNYTGTIELDATTPGNAGAAKWLTFKVGDILKVGAKAGDRVLPLTVAGGDKVDLVLTGATLNGEEADLEFLADGKDGSGIYVAVPGTPGIDPASGVTETTVAYENTGSLSGDELTEAVVAAAVAAGKITPPTEAVTSEAYAAYFTYTVTGESGNYTLAIAGLQPAVSEDVDASVAAQLVSAASGSDMTIAVKPGLYYGFTAGTTPTLAEPELTLATGETVTVAKPGTTQGFVKAKVSATNN